MKVSVTCASQVSGSILLLKSLLGNLLMKLKSMKPERKDASREVAPSSSISSSSSSLEEGGGEVEREEGGSGGGEKFVHCALLGDGMVGKTCLTLRYTQHHFTDHYTATVFDNYPVPVEVGGEEFLISLFDTRGCSDHESLRAYTYQSSEVLVLCFSVCDRDSFYNVLNFWLPEIQRHTKGRTPLLLVGTQIDLRSSSSSSSSSSDLRNSSSSSPSSSFSSSDEVSTEEGTQLAKMIGADCYIECSARSEEGVQQVFEHVVFSALKYRKKKSKILNRLFGDLKISNPLKNFSPPRFFETADVSCC